MKKQTVISRDLLLKDITEQLDKAGIKYTIDNAMSGSIYLRTRNGDIRLSDHNENPNKLTNTKGYLYWDSPIASEHLFKTKSDKKSYELGLVFALKSIQNP